MSYRIQFTITDAEHSLLTKETEEEGFPSTAEYAKYKTLGVNTYADLFKKAVKKIEHMPKNTEFFVRDVISNPPSLLGRWIFDAVSDGRIKNVTHLGKDGADAEKYRKD